MKNITKKFNNIAATELGNDVLINEQNISLLIPEKFIEKIAGMRNAHDETGGYLLGYKVDKSNEFTFTNYSTKMSGDSSTSTDFITGKKHTKTVNKYVKTMRRTDAPIRVIGHWHTHPTDFISFSGIDTELYIQMMKRSKLEFNLHIIFHNLGYTVIVWSETGLVFKRIVNAR